MGRRGARVWGFPLGAVGRQQVRVGSRKEGQLRPAEEGEVRVHVQVMSQGSEALTPSRGKASVCREVQDALLFLLGQVQVSPWKSLV